MALKALLVHWIPAVWQYFCWSWQELPNTVFFPLKSCGGAEVFFLNVFDSVGLDWLLHLAFCFVLSMRNGLQTKIYSMHINFKIFNVVFLLIIIKTLFIEKLYEVISDSCESILYILIARYSRWYIFSLLW